ncbi:hypothetical protein [Catenovulum adriaticum]|uniref:OprO/OprP family phosphate-selective porin n=1 Tax=Catenovulum adriaticum TaxID=2984846 RepID=A0ABY7AI32_9ALTE|nr:hypothetical protein [Catenovulum sp. TS8]WAJ69268.1 OprO/OprP family phosphate-selective porin [Catenovulum sp. TS8]
MRFVQVLLSAALLSASPTVASANTNEINFSGFARLVGGVMLSEDDALSTYDKDLKFNQHSLLGLQASYDLNPDLSVTAQVLGKTQSSNSGLEWLYLKYHLNDNWQIKLGKLHTPFFDYSDVINVGYAYPWVVLPTEIYDSFFFSSFTGGLAEYTSLLAEYNVSIQAYVGQVDETISVAGEEFDVDLDYFNGIAFQLSRGSFNARLSKTLGNYRVDDVGLNPVIDAFTEMGQQWPVFSSVSESLRVEGDVEFTQLSLSYERLNWYLKGEWIDISHEIDLLTELTGYYIIAGYQHNEFTYHLTFSERRGHYISNFPVLPTIGDPEADYLIGAYNQVSQDRPIFNSSTIILGSRWDYQPGLAFKLDLSFISGRPEIHLPTIEHTDFDRQATLLTGSVEWVF